MADSRPLADDFLGHLWPPFTQMAGLEPTIMERADGAVVYDTEGHAYIDAFASLWTVNVGHGRKEIFDAIAAQAEKLAVYHIFQIGNVPSIRRAT
jgi:adenosylmethionine-8-amino-7-oxononanoate aminotransferase